MRIGILTHHYVKNYGAFLQMKGMYETLQRLYPEAEVRIINYVNAQCDIWIGSKLSHKRKAKLLYK